MQRYAPALRSGAFAGMALESYPRGSDRALNQGTGKDRKDCMRQFKAAWERFAGDPVNLTEFLAAKRRARRTRNQLDYSMISKGIWKKWSKCPLPVSIAWQPFPNEKQPSREDPSRQNLKANCADALKSFPVGTSTSTLSY